MGGKSAKRAMHQAEEETLGRRLRLCKYMHVCECVREVGGNVEGGGGSARKTE